MRIRLLATTTWVSLAVAAGTFACTSPESATPSNDEDSGAEEETDEDSGTQETPPVDPPADSGPSDTGVVPSDADVGDGNAGVLYQPGDTKESENNDTPAAADPLTGIPSTYAGRLGAGDVDHATFTLNVATFQTVYAFSTAPITMTATVEGESFDLAGNSYIYKPGKVYVVKITAAAATDYRIQLTP